MGLIGNVIEFVRTVVEGEPVTDVKIDTGGDTETGEHYQPSGFDGHPLPDDYAAALPGPGEGRLVVVGYIDPKNQLTAGTGEARMFSRDADGNIVATILVDAAGFVNLGEDVAAELMARADRVEDELEKIKTEHNTHTHGSPQAASGNLLTTAPSASPTGLPLAFQYTPGLVGADKVKGT